MSIDKLEYEFRNLLFHGKTEKLDAQIKKSKSVLKMMGASVWSIALSSRHAEKNVQLLIKHKASVFLPKPTAKRVSYNSEYTLMVAISHRSVSLLKYIIGNYKLHERLLHEGIVTLCNIKEPFEEQINMLKLLIEAGGRVDYKKEKAIFNATFNDNSSIIPTLIDNGSYLINQKCAVLFLKETKQDPLSYLSICTDERSHAALMDVIAAESINDLPIHHYGND